MKKTLLVLIILLIMVIIPKLNAGEEYRYKEDNYLLTFNNFSSKNINKLFDGLSGGVIEVEIQVKNVVKSYRINTLINDNLEHELSKKVIKHLENEGQRELATIASIKGFKINKITLRCTLDTYEILKERSLNV